MGGNLTNTYVDLFKNLSHAAVLTILHNSKEYPAVIDCVSPYDRTTYVFVDEVAGTTMNSVEFPNNAFKLGPAVMIPADLTMTAACWQADLTVEILDPADSNAGWRAARVPKLIIIPSYL